MIMIQCNKILLGSFIFLFTVNTYAALPPIVDAYEQGGNDTSVSLKPPSPKIVSNSLPVSLPTQSINPMTTLSSEQRIAVLERQVENLNQSLTQFSEMQRQLQETRGRLDLQQHAIDELQNQLKLQYQDLSQRLENLNKTDSVAQSGSLGPKSKILATHAEKKVYVDRVIDPKEVESTANLSLSKDQDAAYHMAFNLLKKKKYASATLAFESYIKKFPDSANLANANYFLGLLYLMQNQPNQAIPPFQSFLKKFSNDPRASDTLFQLGVAYYEKGDKEAGIKIFKKLVREYPASKAANSAQNYLQTQMTSA